MCRGDGESLTSGDALLVYKRIRQKQWGFRPQDMGSISQDQCPAWETIFKIFHYLSCHRWRDEYNQDRDAGTTH